MSTANPRNVPRLASIMDLGGMVLLAIGSGCYLRAYMGLSALRAHGVPRGSARFAGLAAYDRYWQLSRFGLGLCAVAIVVFIIGAILTVRTRRAPMVAQATVQPAIL